MFYSLLTLNLLQISRKRKTFFRMVVNGGYDVKPTENVSSKYECPICLLIIRQPVQTLCGHRFCQICLNTMFDQ